MTESITQSNEDKEIAGLEEQAMHFWDIMLASGLSDGHCKSYDPLTIEPENGGYTFLSYIFDYGDSGRSRFFTSLEDGQRWLLHSFKQWLDDERIEKLEDY